MSDDIEKHSKVKRRRRKPGEVAHRSKAIRNHCLECVGYNQRAVRECTAEKCWLWPWRLGALDRDGVSAETPE